MAPLWVMVLLLLTVTAVAPLAAGTVMEPALVISMLAGAPLPGGGSGAGAVVAVVICTAPGRRTEHERAAAPESSKRALNDMRPSTLNSQHTNCRPCGASDNPDAPPGR